MGDDKTPLFLIGEKFTKNVMPYRAKAFTNPDPVILVYHGPWASVIYFALLIIVVVINYFYGTLGLKVTTIEK